MPVNHHGWEAYGSRDWGNPGLMRIGLIRLRDSRTEHLTRIGGDAPDITAVDSETMIEDWRGLAFPFGAAEAIAEFIKPGPPSDAVARLEEALAIERARVDRMTEVLLRYAAPDGAVG